MTATAIKKKIFFPNLNGVRFVAAMMVLVHHVEQIKTFAGHPSVYNTNKFINNIGGLGVTLFFVLSGFLITYLLLEEKNDFKTINIKEFYTRRILRIWPLYYMIIFLAFYVIPTFFSAIMISDFGVLLQDDYYKKLIMYIFFIPNIAYVIMPPVLFASQAWSIGVEEQFYAIWPIFIKYLKNPLYVMIFIVIIYIVINISLSILVINTDKKILKYIIYENFFFMTRIDCMAVGGIFAYLALHQSIFSSIIQNKFLQLFVYLTTVILMNTENIFRGLGHLPYAILFGIIIFNLALNKDTILSLNHSIFEYGGKISYGIYMFHPIGVVLTFFAYQAFNIHLNIVASNFVFYGASIVLTLLFASLSYNYYEKYFLAKKLKFTSIISGDNALEQNKNA